MYAKGMRKFLLNAESECIYSRDFCWLFIFRNVHMPLGHRFYVFHAEIPLDYAFENRDLIPHQRVHVQNVDAYPKGISARNV